MSPECASMHGRVALRIAGLVDEVGEGALVAGDMPTDLTLHILHVATYAGLEKGCVPGAAGSRYRLAHGAHWKMRQNRMDGLAVALLERPRLQLTSFS